MRVLVTLLMFVVSAHQSFAGAPTWLQWRGPTRDGLIVGPAWPNSLKGDSLTTNWRVPLGPGYSGTIVTENRVFVTETVDKKIEVVRALDRSNGKEIWEKQWPGAMTVPFFARANGDWIRSTPACDGERLFVAGMRDVLVCLSASDGAELWRVDFMQQFKSELPAFGFVSSPLVHNGHVYVQAGASFAKVDAKSGKVVWRTLTDEGGMFGSAFSSPHKTNLNGRDILVVQTRNFLCGVDPGDGGVLWKQKIPAERGMNILTPVVFDGGLFTSAYGGRSLFFKVGEKDGKASLVQQWEHRAQAYMSTPVVIDGYAYLHLRNQRVMCFDLRNGKEMWTTPKPFGKYWSMVAQGDRILALDERGILYLIRANPQRFDLIDERTIADSEAWAHLVVCGEEVFVRDLSGIMSLRWKQP